MAGRQHHAALDGVCRTSLQVLKGLGEASMANRPRQVWLRRLLELGQLLLQQGCLTGELRCELLRATEAIVLRMAELPA